MTIVDVKLLKRDIVHIQCVRRKRLLNGQRTIVDKSVCRPMWQLEEVVIQGREVNKNYKKINKIENCSPGILRSLAHV